jgi:hypothetical protein
VSYRDDSSYANTTWESKTEMFNCIKSEASDRLTG